MKIRIPMSRYRAIFLILALIFFGGVVFAYAYLNDISIMYPLIAGEGICLAIYFVLGLSKKGKSKPGINTVKEKR
ncbi:MAG: hypothetical protein ABSB40_04435 [Nitrososphaeria archaeon]|jgi:membrane-bound acyltransferase YfiQ involved in biofilm formation